ncbi:uncharacterized protein KZ484_001747 [Pholidichthys leucotaenia]
MKLILVLFISCLVLHNGLGAPMTAVYKFLKCNPANGLANCVIHQSPEMELNQDLPSKLPASSAQYLDAKPVEDESQSMDGDEEEEEEDPLMEEEEEEDPLMEEEEEEEDPLMEEEEDDYIEENDEEEYEPYVEEKTPVFSEDKESPLLFPWEEGSGGDEGSAAEGPYMADRAFIDETGSGEFWTKMNTDDVSSLKRLFSSRRHIGEPKPTKEDLKEDHLLQL